MDLLRDWRVKKEGFGVARQSGGIDLREKLWASRRLGSRSDGAVGSGKCLGKSEAQGAGRRLRKGYALEAVDAGKRAPDDGSIVDGDGRARTELPLVDRGQGGGGSGQCQNVGEMHGENRRRRRWWAMLVLLLLLLRQMEEEVLELCISRRAQLLFSTPGYTRFPRMLQRCDAMDEADPKRRVSETSL